MTERERRLQELRNYENYIKEQLKESRRQYLENPFKPYQPPLPLPIHAYPQYPLRPLQAYPLYQPQHPPHQPHPQTRRYTRRILLPPQQPRQPQRYTQLPIQNIQPESIDDFCKRHKYVKRTGVSSASKIPKVHNGLKEIVVKFKRDSNMPIITPSKIPKVHKGLKEFDIKLKRSSRLSAIPES